MRDQTRYEMRPIAEFSYGIWRTFGTGFVHVCNIVGTVEDAAKIVEALNTPNVAWALVEALREPEGNEVRIPCDNPDFNGQPNSYVEVVGAHTSWRWQRYSGDNVLACLKAAYRDMTGTDWS